MFYGSQTGTAEEFANRLSKDAHRYGMRGMAADPEEYDLVSTPRILALPPGPSSSIGEGVRSMEMCKGLSQPKGRTGMGISCHWSRPPGGPRHADVSSQRRARPAFPAPHATGFPKLAAAGRLDSST